jgi:glycosyltransferase involved in cell wall biosynthesis
VPKTGASNVRIVVFSMGPIFPSHVHGGSEKTLTSVVRQLAADGHEVNIYCVRRDDNHVTFSPFAGVVVRPVLPFKQTYPEPYYTAPYRLREVVTTLATAFAEHDRLYIHGGELLYEFVHEDIPTVVSFQDFVYPDTLAGALSFRRDHLITSSTYLRSCVEQVFRSFRPLPPDRLSHIPNGFDVDDMRGMDTTRVRAELRLAPELVPVLFPHRPDPRKGVWEAVGALLRALDSVPDELASRVRLLMPVWVDSNVEHAEEHVYQTLYRELETAVNKAGRPNLLHLHPWLPPDRMAEYYSLGAVTLCVGSFVEAFGNVAIESQLCGTPAIVARVAAMRTVLPENLVSKVDFGDEVATADLIRAALTGELARPGDDVRGYVEQVYPHEGTTRAYARAITEAGVLEPLPAVRLLGVPRAVEIPAWCALVRSGYYNDYEYGYADDPRLVEVARRAEAGPVGVADLAALADDTLLADWIANGYLVPVVS